MAAKITAKQLEELGACQTTVDLFRHVFGEEAEANKENIKKALDSGFSAHSYWAATHFLNDEGARLWYRAESKSGNHRFGALPGDCPACQDEFNAFIELFNQAEYRNEGLPEV